MLCPKCQTELDENMVCPTCGAAETEAGQSVEPAAETTAVSSEAPVEEAIEPTANMDAQSEAYLNAFRAFEAEKAEQARQEKEQKQQKTQALLKKALKIGGAVLLVAALITGIVFVSAKIKARVHELDILKAAVKTNSASAHSMAYTMWENTNKPSDSHKKKVLLKMGKDSLDKDKSLSAIFFFEELGKTKDKKYCKKAIAALDKKFSAYEKKDDYGQILSYYDTYQDLGGHFNKETFNKGIKTLIEKGKAKDALSVFEKAGEVGVKVDAKVIQDSIDALAEKGDYDNAVLFLQKADKQEISIDKATVSVWAKNCAEAGDEHGYNLLLNYLELTGDEISYDPSLEEYRLVFADKYFSAGDYENAYRRYNAYTGKTDCSKNKNTCSYQLGVQAFIDRDFQSAVRYLSVFYGNSKEYKGANKLYLWARLSVAKDSAEKNKKASEDDLRSRIKSSLLNPYSYLERACFTTISVITIDGGKGKPPVFEIRPVSIISYSAQNGFGGYANGSDNDMLYNRFTEKIEAKGLTEKEAKELKDMSASELLKSLSIKEEKAA